MNPFLKSAALLLFLSSCGVDHTTSHMNATKQPHNFSETKQKRFVNTVLSRVVGFQGKCWKYVNDAITGPGGTRMGMSAMEFFRNTPTAQIKSQFGLCKLAEPSGKLVTRIGDAPIGSIIGYRPGQHGFHAKWGHGEIKVSSNRYCSDGCATRDVNMRATFILYPCD